MTKVKFPPSFFCYFRAFEHCRSASTIPKLLSPAKVFTWLSLPTFVQTERPHDWRRKHGNPSEMWRARSMGLICISFRRVTVSAVVKIRDIVLEKYSESRRRDWLTLRFIVNPQSFQMIFEQDPKCNQPSFSFICLQISDSLSSADRKPHSSSRIIPG